MNYLEQLKYLICTVLSGLLTFFFPIKDLMHAMFIVFFVNFVFGVVAGRVNGEEWSWKKAGVFFIHCGLFFFVTSMVFTTGFFMGEREDTRGVVKLLCWVAIWFYSTNIARNWQLMLVGGTIMWKIAGCGQQDTVILGMVEQLSPLLAHPCEQHQPCLIEAH